jgi:hypothetical protein
MIWPASNPPFAAGLGAGFGVKDMSEYISSLINVIPRSRQNVEIISMLALSKACPVGLEGLLMSMMRGSAPLLMASS